MEFIAETITHKLREKYPHLTISCIVEVDPVSYHATNRVIVEGRKTSYTFNVNAFAEYGRQYNKNVDTIATEWVESVVGLDQILLQNRVEV